MLFDYTNVLIFIAVALVFVGVAITLSRIIAPQHPSTSKNAPYECGEEPEGPAWIQFNLRFYLIALIFLIFDVEIVFMYPTAVVFKNWIANNVGIIAFTEIMLFVAILLVGLVYVWAKGDLDWIKKIAKEDA
ncbi:MAG: NADH-quinone oxidoreductase subunit A [Gemmatimonadetes bacterium]|nr:MAG: NADH-quinone oxidoreductase subunit A [Gemmatimonadota bacterium]